MSVLYPQAMAYSKTEETLAQLGDDDGVFTNLDDNQVHVSHLPTAHLGSRM
jgi:hypothetical protein